MHVAERYGTLVTANLHYGDNHTVTTDDPNELRDFVGVAAEMTLLRPHRRGAGGGRRFPGIDSACPPTPWRNVTLSYAYDSSPRTERFGQELHRDLRRHRS